MLAETGVLPSDANATPKMMSEWPPSSFLRLAGRGIPEHQLALPVTHDHRPSGENAALPVPARPGTPAPLADVGGIPEPQDLARTTRHKGLAVGCVDHEPDQLVGNRQRISLHHGSPGQTPELHAAVKRGAGEGAAVGRKGQANDQPVVAGNRRALSPGVGITQHDRPVVQSHGHGFPVGSEHDPEARLRKLHNAPPATRRLGSQRMS